MNQDNVHEDWNNDNKNESQHVETIAEIEAVEEQNKSIQVAFDETVDNQNVLESNEGI